MKDGHDKALERKGLQINQDLRYERRSWITQRVSWALLTLVLLAGLLGLFGSGPVSRTEKTDPTGALRVSYERFTSLKTPTQLTAEAMPAGPEAGELRLWMDRSFAHRQEIRAITPQPDRVEADGDRIVFVIPVTNGAEPVRVKFDLSPQYVGTSRALIGTEAGEEVRLSQFTYP